MFNDGGSAFTMPVAPAYGYGGGYNNNGFFGGDGIWGGLLLGLLFGGLGGWGGFGGFGGGWGNMMGFDATMFPYFFNAQTQNDVNRGFDTQNIGQQINAVQSSIDSLRTENQLSGIQSAITAGFGDTALGIAGINQNICQTGNGIVSAVNGAQTALAAQMYNNEIANLNRSFAEQTANTQGFNNVQAQLAQCCCDNRLSTESLRATVLSENCEDRNQALLNTRDIIQAITSSVQSIKDQLCADKIESKNDLIGQLRQELIFARGQASQIDQTAQIRAAQATTANQLVSELRSCPIPAQPVYGNTPIFTCNSGCGNGCGCNNF